VSVPSVTSETRHFEHRPPALAQRILRVLSEIATRRDYSVGSAVSPHLHVRQATDYLVPCGTMAVMPSWRDYQEEAAEFFRDLGHDATTDERITGARGTHRVDVAVRTKHAIPQLWIVECKRWQRPVNKEHVLALSEIVKDVGAHSGIMLSESGFQAGAILVARFSNVTLTSLSTLRESVGLADVSAADLLAFFGEVIRSVAARVGPPPAPFKPLPVEYEKYQA